MTFATGCSPCRRCRWRAAVLLPSMAIAIEYPRLHFPSLTGVLPYLIPKQLANW